VQKAVHPIKSSASNIGARQLRELAARLEQLAIDQQGDSIPALLGELEVALVEVKSLLEQQREKLHVHGKESVQ
jgi:HPt (histidine-containing phosphotransfer) domain-containing protein